MTDAIIRLQAEKHPLVATQESHTLQDHCLQLMHLRAYEEIGVLARDRTVLDLGCNHGYGTSILNRHAARTVGVDVSARAIETARQRHSAEGVDFLPFDGTTLPFDDGRFDLIASCQVIEHVPDADRYLSEIRRVLAPQGLAALTTPNAAIRLDPGATPWNRFHVHEYSGDDLARTLRRHFPSVDIFGLFATPELHAVEVHRCHQAREISRWMTRSPYRQPLRVSWRAAAIGTALRMLPAGAVSGAKGIVNVARRARPRREGSPNRFTTADFHYRSEDIDSSLDLLAICRLTPDRQPDANT